jgi:hypothetical protein
LRVSNSQRNSSALALVLLVGSACAPSVFTCIEREQCIDGERTGTCQPEGYCSFDDVTCPSGQRYGTLAGKEHSDACVDPSGSVDAGTAVADTGADSSSEEETTVVEMTTDSTSVTTGCSVTRWHRDADGDGFGDPNDAIEACEAPPGYVEDGNDCDDADPRVNPDHLGCPNPSSLVGWWRFDGIGEEVFVDSSDYGNDGVPIGMPANDVLGPYREALRLDGVAQGVDVSTVVSDLAPTGAPPPSGTLEAWARSGGPNEQCVQGAICAELVVQIGPSTALESVDGFGPIPEAHIHTLYDPDTQSWSWGMYVGDADANCRPSSSASRIFVVEGQWTHLAAVWSDDECRLYVDGELVDHEALLAIPLGNWDAASVGTTIERNRRWFHGAIDEVMLFDEARTPAQIRADCGSPQCS